MTHPGYERAKRCLDVLIALAATVVTAPLMILIAVAIRLEDRGAAVLRQSRVGLDGRDFDLLKFRTMVPDAHSLGTGWLIAEHDPRITRVGRVLRKWSLDELPQVLNVLRGEMSIVGPRPTLRYQVEQYTPFQQRRLAVRPGITGWAQIRGRNALGWPQRIELDVWYVEHRSLRLDLLILLRTVPMLFTSENVYNEARGDWGEVVDPAGHAEVSRDAPAESQA
jgi:lipopolysaccharide/colanic/teichoic acid biosynthesis glycosyltransferase